MNKVITEQEIEKEVQETGDETRRVYIGGERHKATPVFITPAGHLHEWVDSGVDYEGFPTEKCSGCPLGRRKLSQS